MFSINAPQGAICLPERRLLLWKKLTDNGFTCFQQGKDIIAMNGITTILAASMSNGTYTCVAVDMPLDEIVMRLQKSRLYGKYSMAELVYNSADKYGIVESSKVHLWNHDHSIFEIKGALRSAH